MKISLITPTFNSAKTIDKTLESVENQTFLPFEHIIIDGGSKDETLKKITGYAQRIKNYQVKVISEPDMGVFDAMNKGIRLATGDVIGIVNSDDWFERDALESINENFDIHNTDVLIGIVRYLKNGRELFIERTHIEYINTRMTTHPGTFISRQAYSDYGLYDLKFRYGADLDLMLRYKKYGARFDYIDKVISNFAMGGNSSSPFAAIEGVKIRRNSMPPYKYYLKLMFLYLVALFKIH